MKKPSASKAEHTTEPPAVGTPLLAVPQVAELRSVRPEHVYRLVAQRRIPFLKLGRLVRFEPCRIGAWIASGRVEPVH